MSGRSVVLLRALLVIVAIVALLPLTVKAQTTNDSSLPPTAWGAPDLQGVWDFRTLTPFERPEELGDKAVLTDEEVAEYIY